MMNRVVQLTIQAWLALLILPVGATRAQGYTIDWYSIDGGGGVFGTGGNYELSGTIGEADAGEMSGGAYSVTGGFWFPLVPGDCDGDGDVDLNDFVELEACLLGPGGGLGVGCTCFDLDDSGDVDLFDFAQFQVAFTG